MSELLAEESQNKIREQLENLVKRKLVEKGVNIDTFPIKQLVEHILKGSSNEFLSDRDSKDIQHIKIDFTAKDVAELELKVKNITSINTNEQVLLKFINLECSRILRDLEKEYPEQKILDDIDLYEFKSMLAMTWMKPLDLFRMQLMFSLELHSAQVESFSRSKAKTGKMMRKALIDIHNRALRTSRSILVLLENGLSDDAYARWRTLYELYIIGEFIVEYGDVAAERYLEHEYVSIKESMDNQILWGISLDKVLVQEITENYENVINKYGVKFKQPYGWASGFIDERTKMTFSAIEHHVQGNVTIPFYKQSSFQVHGGRVGLLGISSLDENFVGQSVLGLDVPLSLSSHNLMMLTILLNQNSPSQDVFIINTLYRLHSKISWHSKRIGNKMSI